MSRREFIKFLIILGSTFALGKLGANITAAEEEKQEKTIQQQETQNRLKEETKEKASYVETTFEQCLLMITKAIASVILEKLKIEHGNKTLTKEDLIKYLREKPIQGLIKIVFLAPLVKEALFRPFPQV